MMKNPKHLNKSLVVLLVVLIGLTMYNLANAQQNTVKTNLMNLVISGGSLHYERVLGDHSSAQLGMFYSGISVEETKFRGFGVIPQYRLYPGSRNETPHGFFFAPLVSYQVFSLETTAGSVQNAKASYKLVGAGLDIGNQWLINRAFSIELSLGVAFNTTNLSIKTEGVHESEFSIGGFGSTTPRFGLSLGYAF